MHRATAAKSQSDIWLGKHFEEVVNKYAGEYVVISGSKGIIFTDKDGSPRQIVEMAKSKYPSITPLFFRVPTPQDLLCVLTIE